MIMSIAIILRKNPSHNWFRNIILAALQYPAGDHVLICSGFFQELFNNSSYRISLEGNIASLLARNNISVTTVGIHNPSWLPSYRNFRDSLLNAGVSVTSLVTNYLHWHAKVLILKASNNPILGIVGSSNMTRNAFSNSSPFNYEADVFLWEDTNANINPVMAEQLAQIEDPNELIRAPYDPELNHGLSIPRRLIDLEKEVLSTPLKQL